VQIIKKYKKDLAISVVAAFCIALIGLSFGKVVQRLIDYGIKTGDLSQIKHYTCLMIFLSVFFAFFSFIRSFYSNIIAEKIGNDLTLQLYDHIIKAKQVNFLNINHIFIDDIAKFKNFFATQISYFARNIIMFCVGIIFLANISIFLFFCLVFTAFSILLIVLCFLPLVKKYNKLTTEINFAIVAHLLQGILMKKLVNIFNIEDVNSVFDKKIELEKVVKQKHLYRSAMIGFVLLIALLCAAFSTFFGASFVVEKTLTAGQFSSFLMYMIIIISSLIGISNFKTDRAIFIASKNRISEILALECEKNEGFVPQNINIFVKNINILHGQKNAIVGKSGIGKSTIVDLILGFLNIKNEDVIIDNVSIKNINIIKWREMTSLCLQNTDLFDLSVAENIFYGQKFDNKKYIEILQDLNLEHLAECQTNQLSVGEKQRINIARTLLKNAQLFIFDEPTSALDEKNRNLVWQAINKYTNQKTVIIITHNIDNIDLFDNIIKLD